jgi:hypothetical protein
VKSRTVQANVYSGDDNAIQRKDESYRTENPRGNESSSHKLVVPIKRLVNTEKGVKSSHPVVRVFSPESVVALKHTEVEVEVKIEKSGSRARQNKGEIGWTFKATTTVVASNHCRSRNLNFEPETDRQS